MHCGCDAAVLPKSFLPKLDTDVVEAGDHRCHRLIRTTRRSGHYSSPIEQKERWHGSDVPDACRLGQILAIDVELVDWKA
jgi:hypothetical protein